MEIKTEQNELAVIIAESGLEKTKSQVLLDKFTDYFALAADWEIKSKALVVDNVNQVAEMKMADEGRKFLKQKRIDIERTRKELKDSSLREGQTIDSIAKILKNLIEPIENDLELKAKFKELREAELKAELKEKRQIEIAKYSEFMPFGIDLSNMNEEDYSKLFNGCKMQFEAKEQAEIKAEQERIEAEKKERERIEAQRLENERLKAEAIEKEKQLAEERAKADLERKKIEEKAAKEKAELDAKLKAEREANEKMQAELKAKAEKEEQARREEIRLKMEADKKANDELKAKREAEEKAAKAPIKKQLSAWVDTFQIGKPITENETSKEIEVKFEAFKTWAKQLINK